MKCFNTDHVVLWCASHGRLTTKLVPFAHCMQGHLGPVGGAMPLNDAINGGAHRR